MANVRKKVINQWDTGITTNSRDNNPDTSFGSQMIENFDVYKDARRLVPMQEWEDFTTTEEKALGIRAMGGTSDTVFGLGSGITNWLQSWDKRIKVEMDSYFYQSSNMPLRLDMSLLPQDFWDNTQDNMQDVRVVSSDGVSLRPSNIENLDRDAQTGDLWFSSDETPNVVLPVVTQSSTPTVNTSTALDNGTFGYAHAVNFTAPFNIFKYTAFKQTNRTITGTISAYIYTDGSGSPGTLLHTLFEDKSIMELSNTAKQEIVYLTDTIDITGTHYIVFTRDGDVDADNKALIPYTNTGSETVLDSGSPTLASWNVSDSSATPYYILEYVDRTEKSFFYIYYGNTSVTQPQYGVQDNPLSFTNEQRDVFTSSNLRFAYTFGDNKANNKYYADNLTGQTEAFETNPSFISGLFGNAIKAITEIGTDQDDEVALTGNDISISFLMRYTGSAINRDIIENANSGFRVSTRTDGAISFFVDGVSGGDTSISNTILSPNVWYVVDMVFDNNHYIYINGVEDDFLNTNDGNYDDNPTNDRLLIDTGNTIEVSHVFGYNRALSADQVATKYFNFTQPAFFTVGTPETLEFPQYGGVQVYTKNLTGGDWQPLTRNGQLVLSLDHYPVNSFINDSLAYFIVSQQPENAGFLFLAKSDDFTPLDPNHLLLTPIQPNSSKVVVQPETPLDRTTYFNYGNARLASVGDPGNSNEYTVGGTVQSMSAWRDYMGIGYNFRNRAFIDIWDLAGTNATERVDLGGGNVRIVGNASDILFGVVDNFTDDAVKSTNNPSVDIKQYVGNGQSQEVIKLEIPAVVTGYSNDWERMVSNFKMRRNTQTLFYMRIPKDATATEFWEGLWAIGKSSQGQLSLTLQISTEGLGMPENIFGFAQQVFFIQKDGGIKRLSDTTYTKTSLFRTLKMNEGNTEIEKKLIGIEIVTEPLEANQVVSVYYKRDGQDERVKILEMSGEGEITKESVTEFETGHNLGHYKEIEFDIESTGGKSAVLEVNYKYEYLSDIV